MQSSWLVLLRQSQPSSSLFHRGPIEAQYLLASHWEPRAHAPATEQPSHPIKCAFARSTNTTITATLCSGSAQLPRVRAVVVGSNKESVSLSSIHVPDAVEASHGAHVWLQTLVAIQV